MALPSPIPLCCWSLLTTGYANPTQLYHRKCTVKTDPPTCCAHPSHEQICQQTQESIGILEELGIPAIACINKIDLPAFADTTRYAVIPPDILLLSFPVLRQLHFMLLACTLRPGRLDALEAELKEYVALSDAPIVRISAKGERDSFIVPYCVHTRVIFFHVHFVTDKLNFPTLLEKLEGIAYRTSPTKSNSPVQKPTRTIRGGRTRRQPVVPDNSEDTEILNIVSSGTILNIFKSRQQGVSLHVIVRSGEVSVNDVRIAL